MKQYPPIEHSSPVTPSFGVGVAEPEMQKYPSLQGPRGSISPARNRSRNDVIQLSDVKGESHDVICLTCVAVHSRKTSKTFVGSFQSRHIVKRSIRARVLSIETGTLRTVVTLWTGLRVLYTMRTECVVLNTSIAVVTSSARITRRLKF